VQVGVKKSSVAFCTREPVSDVACLPFANETQQTHVVSPPRGQPIRSEKLAREQDWYCISECYRGVGDGE
jgi:hypothetical protein